MQENAVKSFLGSCQESIHLFFLANVSFAYLVAGSPLFAEQIQFNRDVRPILSENCLACHGFDHAKREAGLRLDTREGALATLDSGHVAVQPGKPDTSELVRRILLKEDDDECMPLASSGKKLSDKQRQILQAWVEQGAEYEKHWSFIPPVKVELPLRTNEPNAEHANPIDWFVHDKLVQNGLTPSKEADPTTLIRRLSLDITGLPPTMADVDAFVANWAINANDAYNDLADRLLRSSHYGERWGRWWLDQARYADSNGYSVDSPRQIWKYRDWVIDALNRDMPFDQFTIEQLAGDLLPGATEQQKIATGFHRNTQINQEGGIDVEQFRIDSVFDRVATTGTVFLGLTVGCAQCHDHKFDPILQKEYYQLFAFFNNQEEPTLTVYPPELNAADLIAEKKQLDKVIRDVMAKMDSAIETWEAQLTEEQRIELPKETQKILSGDKKKKRTAPQKEILYADGIGATDVDFKKTRDRIRQIDTMLEQGVNTLVMKELAQPRKTTVFVQGDFTRPSEEVSCGTPSVLHSLDKTKSNLNRLDLAQWIVSPTNPLTSRVIVNRVWQNYFGRGLVESENDFGMQGALPTHPELLDWLAVEFIEQGRSLKALHKLIVTSNTYRQSSIDRPELREKDRENTFLAKQRRLRLDAEIVRDVGLSASGLLSSKMGGAPVYPPIPDGVMNQGQVKREWKVSTGEDRYRRGLYTFLYRATPPPSLNVFDAPEGNSSCTRRIRSNTPLQALTLLNDAAFFEFAKALEKIIEHDGIEAAFQRCTSRPPRADEIEILGKLDRLSAARVLLNLDETVTRE
ncbi:MAG: PSD1 and planctomycete cytochrome C domain-containing protein [Pirellula sp.]